MTEKMELGVPRYTGEVTLSGGSWDASYPLSNAKDWENLGRPARSADLQAASLVIRGTLPKKRSIGWIGIVGHNLGVNATARFKGYDDAAWTTETVDSGDQFIWPTDPSLDPEWEDDNWWTHTYNADEVEGTQPIGLIRLEDKPFIQSFELTLKDDGNADGKIRFRLLEICKGTPLPVNFEYGAGIGFKSRALVVEADGGGEYFEGRPKPRQFEGRVGLLPRDISMGVIYELQRQLDVHTPFLMIMNPADVGNWHREVALVRNQSLTPIRRAFAQRDGWEFNFKERI